jgi:RNA polymerase sigma-70 factor (ECF subfamily)
MDMGAGSHSGSEGSSAQFDALVTPHLMLLYRMAYRLVRNAPDAHDLVQDTCIAACENLRELRRVDRPDRWLLRVLQNRFINVAKRRRRSPLVPLEDTPDVAHFASNDPGPEDLLQQSEVAREFERAFLQLEAMQRTLLSLRAEGYGLTEIANITGVGKEVLRARLHRARRSLAHHLEHQPDAPRPAIAIWSER